MKKVKLKLNHSTISDLVGKLIDHMQAYEYDTHAKKMYVALWTEVVVKLQAKGLFYFKGETKVSLTTAQGLSLLISLKSIKPSDDYQTLMFTEIIAAIDKQTA